MAYIGKSIESGTFSVLDTVAILIMGLMLHLI